MSAIETYLAKPWLAHYQKGVPAAVEVPLKSLAQAFDEATERAPERTAVVFYGRSISYRELREATDREQCRVFLERVFDILATVAPVTARAASREHLLDTV